MAEELIKGLDSFYDPRFLELTARIDRLDMLVKDLTDTVRSKDIERRRDMDGLGKTLESQGRHGDDSLHALEERMVEFNSRRCYEIQELTESVQQRATVAEMGRLAEQLRSLGTSTDERVDTVHTVLTKQLDGLAADFAARKTSTEIRVDNFAARFQALSELVDRKAGVEVTNAHNVRLEALASEVALRATNMRAEELGSQLQALSERNAQKAEDERVDKLERIMGTLGKNVEQRATGGALDKLSSQVKGLTDRMVVEENRIHQISKELQGNHDKLHTWWTRASEFQRLPDDNDQTGPRPPSAPAPPLRRPVR